MADGLITSGVGLLIHGVVASAVVAGWAYWNRLTQPTWRELGSGRITPGKISAFVIVAIGLAMAT